MRLLPYGVDGLLAEVDSVAQATALYAAARSAGLRVTDVVPAARTVLFDGVADPEELEAWLRRVELDLPAAASSAKVVEVPTVYDGDDLDDVARFWGTSPEEAVALHTRTEFTVAFCGFSPGFAYCTGLPGHLSVPRLETPRAWVPAGSVAVAGEFTGVYPRSSPGGWRLLGRTDVTLWDLHADEPALLSPGTRVRFVQESR